MQHKIIIETQRLQLREMTTSDYSSLHAVLGDPINMQHYTTPFDQAHISRWIDKNIEWYAQHKFGLWAVVLKQTGEMIGDCGLTYQNINGVVCPEIGYHIRRDCHRKGYAKEAAAAVRDWAFENTSFEKLYSYMAASNVASYSTAMSIGMKKVDQYVDKQGTLVVVYSITKQEWKKLI